MELATIPLAVITILVRRLVDVLQRPHAITATRDVVAATRFPYAYGIIPLVLFYIYKQLRRGRVVNIVKDCGYRMRGIQGNLNLHSSGISRYYRKAEPWFSNQARYLLPDKLATLQRYRIRSKDLKQLVHTKSPRRCSSENRNNNLEEMQQTDFRNSPFLFTNTNNEPNIRTTIDLTAAESVRNLEHGSFIESTTNTAQLPPAQSAVSLENSQRFPENCLSTNGIQNFCERGMYNTRFHNYGNPQDGPSCMDQFLCPLKSSGDHCRVENRPRTEVKQKRGRKKGRKKGSQQKGDNVEVNKTTRSGRIYGHRV